MILEEMTHETHVQMVAQCFVVHLVGFSTFKNVDV